MSTITIFLMLMIILSPSYANTFKVFHNTLDPSVFGTTGGLRLNETGEGYVSAFTMCIRFQGHCSEFFLMKFFVAQLIT